MANATERALRRKRKSAAAGRSGDGDGKERRTFNPQIKKRKFKKNPNLVPLGGDAAVEAKGSQATKEPKTKKKKEGSGDAKGETFLLSTAPAAQQLTYFLNLFQSTSGVKLSALELEPFKEMCMVELPQDVKQDVGDFCMHVKSIFKESWKEELCRGNLIENTIEAGSPAILIISGSAVRSLELVRGLKSLTKECQPAKLFAKHIKLEEQITSLKNRVNIATGTPSRIKKLIDVEALGLSRLALVVLDMQDAKGFSPLTLPQVSNEFWELYKSHFCRRLIEGDTRICFYGPTSAKQFQKVIQSEG